MILIISEDGFHIKSRVIIVDEDSSQVKINKLRDIKLQGEKTEIVMITVGGCYSGDLKQTCDLKTIFQ